MEDATPTVISKPPRFPTPAFRAWVAARRGVDPSDVGNEEALQVASSALGDVVLSHEAIAQLDLLSAGVMAPELAVDLPMAPDLRDRSGGTGDEPLSLRDQEGVLLAVVQDGELSIVRRPVRYAYVPLRRTAEEVRSLVPGPTPVAVLADGPIHSDIVAKAVEQAGESGVVLASLVGEAAADDPSLHRTVQAHQAVVGFMGSSWVQTILPLSLPEGWPGQELAGLVARNLGCADVLVVRAGGAPEAAPVSGHEALDAAVDRVLARFDRPRGSEGFTVLFTGLSGSGKSTVAGALMARLAAIGSRQVTLLDGDLVRKHLSSELSFSREHRDLNVSRIGFVSSVVTKHGGIAIAAPIAPYDATRKAVRQMVEAVGAFVLVHVSTPLEVCEARDRKGLYARARAGQLPAFTGISDPYEAPDDADVVLDTSTMSVAEAAQAVVDHLLERGLLTPEHALLG